MRHATIATVLLAAVAGWGCATTPAPVPVMGEVERLAGEWSGEYTGVQSGRTGSIIFSLAAGKDTAYGDVLMVPRGGIQGYLPEREIDMDGEHRRDSLSIPRMLTIAFARAGEGRVSGTLDPYRSPDCGCLLNTTFTGALEGDSISGTYVAVHEDGDMEYGTWKVKRKRAH